MNGSGDFILFSDEPWQSRHRPVYKSTGQSEFTHKTLILQTAQPIQRINENGPGNIFIEINIFRHSSRLLTEKERHQDGERERFNA